MKLKQMISNPKQRIVDEELVKQVLARIPDWTWTVVKQAIASKIVDQMSSTVLERLTGDPQGFDRAEEILDDYYRLYGTREELVTDAFHILGEEATLYLLDSLRLDQYKDPNEETKV